MALKTKYLSSAEKILLTVIADNCDNTGYTKRSTLHFKNECGWSSPATFTKHMDTLRGVGLVKTVTRASTKNGRQTNITHIVRGKLEPLVSRDPLTDQFKMKFKDRLISVRKNGNSFKTSDNEQTHKTRAFQGLTSENEARNTNNDLAPITSNNEHNIGELCQEDGNGCTDFDLQSECESIANELDTEEDPSQSLGSVKRGKNENN